MSEFQKGIERIETEANSILAKVQSNTATEEDLEKIIKLNDDLTELLSKLIN